MVLNRHRSKGRPANLSSDITIDTSQLPDNFYRGMVTNAGEKHVVLMSDYMIEKLAECKVWYIDGTFRIINKPFSQLLGIHGFISNR